MPPAIDDPILNQYIEDRASKSKQSPADLAPQISREDFYKQVNDLHGRFMKGEFSLGYMANLLGVTKPDSYQLLDAMGLKVTNL